MRTVIVQRQNDVVTTRWLPELQQPNCRLLEQRKLLKTENTLKFYCKQMAKSSINIKLEQGCKPSMTPCNFVGVYRVDGPDWRNACYTVFSPSLNTLRDWFSKQQELGKSQKSILTGYKLAASLVNAATDRAVTKSWCARTQAYYKQLMVVEQPTAELRFACLTKISFNYLNSPPGPLLLTDKKVEDGSGRIPTINFEESQTEQLATVEASHKSFSRLEW